MYAHRGFRRGEQGQAAVILAVMFTVLIGICGLVITGGMGQMNKRLAQNATDAASLAAAYSFYTGDTSLTAATTLADNQVAAEGFTASQLTLTFYNSSGQTTTNGSQVAAVGASLTDNNTIGFGRTAPSVVATANAAVSGKAGDGGGTAVCGLCVLSATASKALEVEGSSTVSVTDGSIVIDSSASNALYETSSTVTATAIKVVGGDSLSGGTVSPTPTLTSTSVTNPLAELAAPVVPGSAEAFTTACPIAYGSCTISPGIYTGFAPASSIQLTMNPGTYVLEGGLSVSNGAAVTATSGVSIYVTCSGYTSTHTEPCTGSDGVGVSLTGSGAVNLTAPSTGAQQGLAIMMDPHDSAGVTLENSGELSLSGTLLAADSALTMTGSGSASLLNSVVIVLTAHISNSGALKLGPTSTANAPGTYTGIPMLAS